MHKKFWRRNLKINDNLETRGREWTCNNKIDLKNTLRPDWINLVTIGKVSCSLEHVNRCLCFIKLEEFRC